MAVISKGKIIKLQGKGKTAKLVDPPKPKKDEPAVAVKAEKANTKANG